jgi:hypothetical protein
VIEVAVVVRNTTGIPLKIPALAWLPFHHINGADTTRRSRKIDIADFFSHKNNG